MLVILVLKMNFLKLKNDCKYLKLFLLQLSRVTTIPGLPYFLIQIKAPIHLHSIFFSTIFSNYKFSVILYGYL